MGGSSAPGATGLDAAWRLICDFAWADFRFYQFHRLTVDCYALQNREKHMKSGQAYAAHLIGMYLAVETKDTDRSNGAVQKWLKQAGIHINKFSIGAI